MGTNTKLKDVLKADEVKNTHKTSKLEHHTKLRRSSSFTSYNSSQNEKCRDISKADKVKNTPKSSFALEKCESSHPVHKFKVPESVNIKGCGRKPKVSSATKEKEKRCSMEMYLCPTPN